MQDPETVMYEQNFQWVASSKIKDNLSGPVSLVDWQERDWSWQSTALAWAVPHRDWKTNDLVNTQSHRGRFAHELAVLWVVLWKEICSCPKFALCFWRVFLLQCGYILMHSVLTAAFLFTQGLMAIPNFHSLWWIHGRWNPLWPKGLLPNFLTPCSHIRVIYRTSSTYCLYCLAACSGVFRQYAQVFLFSVLMSKQLYISEYYEALGNRISMIELALQIPKFLGTYTSKLVHTEEQHIFSGFFFYSNTEDNHDILPLIYQSFPFDARVNSS